MVTVSWLLAVVVSRFLYEFGGFQDVTRFFV